MQLFVCQDILALHHVHLPPAQVCISLNKHEDNSLNNYKSIDISHAITFLTATCDGFMGLPRPKFAGADPSEITLSLFCRETLSLLFPVDALEKKTLAATTAAITITPPTTPPAIAPCCPAVSPCWPGDDIGTKVALEDWVAV